MKTKLPFIAVIAILLSACSTGSHLARTYDDDIYFSPTDAPPVAIVEEEAPANEKSARINNSNVQNKKLILSQMDQNTDGSSSVNNYIYQPDEKNRNSDFQSYDMDNQELAESDTTLYYNDEDVKYVINNYYDDNDNRLDFSYRINRFHRPYYYSPFFYDYWDYGYYSPWNYGYYGWNNGWGYNSWNLGWGSPYSYYGYYSPFSFGFGGYYGYGGYGGYYNSYYGGYYGGGYGGYYGGGYYGSGGSYYSRHEVARRRSTEMNLPGGGSNGNIINTGSRSAILKSGNSENHSGGQINNSNGRSSWVENGHVRSRSIDASGGNVDTKNATIVNQRRSSNTSSDGRRSSIESSQMQRSTDPRTQLLRSESNGSGNVRRSYQPSTTGRTYSEGRTAVQNQNYTPSYNKPRVVNQSNYNNSYTRPRTSDGGTERSSIKSASYGSSGSGSTYTEPRSSSSMRQTYRSSSSYSSGSSSSPTRSSSSYSSPSNPSYSAPARSSSSSYSSGSSYSGGSGSGSSSSGSSSSGSSGGSSNSSSGGGSGSRR